MKELDYLNSSVEKAEKRIKEFIKGDAFVMGFITDVHSYGNEHYKQLRHFILEGEKLNADLLINGGDIGIGCGETKEEAEFIIAKTKEAMITDTPLMFCKGNHDFGGNEISNVRINEEFCMPSAKKHKDLITVNSNGEGGGYSLYKNEEKKVEVLTLNTSEGNTGRYVISKEQFSWIIKTLQNVKDGFRVFVVSHFCIDEMGIWKAYGSVIPDCMKKITYVLRDFNLRVKGEVEFEGETVSWDFMKVPSNVKLICSLHGDSHFDNSVIREGVKYVVRQGYGGVSDDNLHDGAIYRPFLSNRNAKMEKPTDCLYDFICLNSDNTAKIIRMGIGDKDADVIL